MAGRHEAGGRNDNLAGTWTGKLRKPKEKHKKKHGKTMRTTGGRKTGYVAKEMYRLVVWIALNKRRHFLKCIIIFLKSHGKSHKKPICIFKSHQKKLEETQTQNPSQARTLRNSHPNLKALCGIFFFPSGLLPTSEDHLQRRRRSR